MKKIIIFIIIILALTGNAIAALTLPSISYGEILIDGLPAQDGLVIDAVINGQTYQTTTIQGYYLFVINADDSETGSIEGGVNEQIVNFRYDSQIASSTLIFASGRETVVDLSFTSVPRITCSQGCNSYNFQAGACMDLDASQRDSLCSNYGGSGGPVDYQGSCYNNISCADPINYASQAVITDCSIGQYCICANYC